MNPRRRFSERSRMAASRPSPRIAAMACGGSLRATSSVTTPRTCVAIASSDAALGRDSPERAHLLRSSTACCEKARYARDATARTRALPVSSNCCHASVALTASSTDASVGGSPSSASACAMNQMELTNSSASGPIVVKIASSPALARSSSCASCWSAASEAIVDSISKSAPVRSSGSNIDAVKSRCSASISHPSVSRPARPARPTALRSRASSIISMNPCESRYPRCAMMTLLNGRFTPSVKVVVATKHVICPRRTASSTSD